MVGGVFYEHSHRLLGSVGRAADAWCWPSRSGRAAAPAALAIVAVVAVVAQGVLGGLRVVLLTDGLAMVHGRWPRGSSRWSCDRADRLRAHGAAGSVAGRRHPRPHARGGARSSMCRSCSARCSPTPGRIDLHLVGALAVFALVPVVTARLRRTGDAVAAPAARALLRPARRPAPARHRRLSGRFPRWIPGGQLHDAASAGGASPGRRASSWPADVLPWPCG